MSKPTLSDFQTFGKKCVSVSCRAYYQLEIDGEDPSAQELLDLTADTTAEILGMDRDTVAKAMNAFLKGADKPADKALNEIKEQLK